MNLKAQEPQQENGTMVCPRGLETFPSGHTHCPTHKVELVEQTRDPLIGQTINDRYKILDNISAGGWASIYRAQDQQDKTEIALKIMHSYLLADKEAVARFKREAKAAGGLSHPSLARVMDAGVLAEGQPFLTMEYISGITLADRILTLGPLTAEQAIPIFVLVCDALFSAHERGIIHRDIKPSNLMLSKGPKGEDEVKLVDFGLARAMESTGVDSIDQITRSGQTLGSPAYMSPEQCLGYKLDARSDIYSLGCTMYEAVSGRPPFTAQSILEYMHKHTYEEPPGLEIRSQETNFGYNMAHVIMQTLTKNPADRQQSMAQVRDQLRACMWTGNVPPPSAPAETPVPAAERQPKKLLSRTSFLGSTFLPLLMVAILLALFVFVLRAAHQDQPGQPDAKDSLKTKHK